VPEFNLDWNDLFMNIPSEPILIPGRVEPVSGQGGLRFLRLKADGGTAVVCLHGAHVTEFVPSGSAPVLWMSEFSFYETGKPIRGGIPVCWPWFGPHGADPGLPAHGIARLREWTPMESVVLHDGRVRLRLGFQPTDAEAALIPGSLRAELTVTVGTALDVALCTINDGAEPAAFEDALHTYFAVGGLEGVTVTGLEGCVYQDSLEARRLKVQEGPVRFTAETDRVYADRAPCTEIMDKAFGRRILIEKSGSASTVVWNPWIAKSKAMADFGDDEWTGMCCVETANVRDGRVALLPGNRHETRVRISVI